MLSGCEPPKQSAKNAAAEKAAGDETGAKAEKVLRQMCDYLGELPAFSCGVEAVMRIQAKGMDNRMETKMDVRLERPNRFALVVDKGVMGTTIISDGTQLVQYVPMTNKYTIKEAPADLAGLTEADGAMGMTGLTNIILPTSGDDFYNKIMEGVTESEYVGVEKIGDVECHHLRFDQEDFGWDIWIEKGERPVVHKMVPDLTKRMADAGAMLEDAKLEYSIDFSDWNVKPTFTDSDFAFAPPEGAEEVESLMEGFAGAGGGMEEVHVLVGQPAPPFQTVNHEGQPIDLSSHLGKDVILLDFWATWCGPCIEAMPEVDSVAEKFADRGLVFYAVNSGEDAETVKEFLKTEEMDVPVAMDIDNKISELYVVNGIPQTVLIGKDGKVQVVHVGFGQNLGELLTREVEDLLAGKDLASEAQAQASEAGKEQGESPDNAEASKGEDAAIDGENTVDTDNGANASSAKQEVEEPANAEK
jgi:peroxiredoxin